jgi:hypothetical protein
MAGLVPAISLRQVFTSLIGIAGTSPAMTKKRRRHAVVARAKELIRE